MANGERGGNPTNLVKRVVALCTVIAVGMFAILLLRPDLAGKLAAIALLLVGLLAALLLEFHEGRIEARRCSDRTDPPIEP
ncbi:hypothetical protein P3W85_09975 [Cupriavidus basilensis]|uniref:Uncharacterized protein n=1 Tax=Cupriavidus basilensis TaxID=68895 RepID=A0ABT6AKY5_9BURK|nr:hypothetical protein [Cupriavidus basilensis]MDF3833271.1 hypothetical protein [Cupriavidus basilensis]